MSLLDAIQRYTQLTHRTPDQVMKQQTYNLINFDLEREDCYRQIHHVIPKEYHRRSCNWPGSDVG